MAQRLTISGHVQGVGFRYSMASEARRLGVTGWVRNRRDGTVEAVIDGPDEAMQAMLAWVRHGPRGAHVASVRLADAAGTFDRFETRATE